MFRPSDLMNFDDVVAAAEEFLPSMIEMKFIIDESEVCLRSV